MPKHTDLLGFEVQSLAIDAPGTFDKVKPYGGGLGASDLEFEDPVDEIFGLEPFKSPNKYYKEENGKEVLQFDEVIKYLSKKHKVSVDVVKAFLTDSGWEGLDASGEPISPKPGTRDLPIDRNEFQWPKSVSLSGAGPKEYDVEKALDTAFNIWPGAGEFMKGTFKRNLRHGDKVTPGVTDKAWWHKKQLRSDFLDDNP